MNRAIRFLLLGAFTLSSAWPQASTGTVSGTVRDNSGGVIPNVSTTLTNTATGVVLNTQTNGSGFYMFQGVIAGSYRLSVTAPGMEKFEGAMQVQVAQSAVVDPVLQPSQVTTTVKVQDVTPLVTVDNPTVSQGLESARIEQLPMNGRQLNILLGTLPGMEGTSSFRSFGMQADGDEWVVDGAVTTDRRWNMALLSQSPGLGSFQEFTVLSDAVSAKYTRPINIVVSTKGGTNTLHGSAYETNRNNGVGLARARTDYYTKPPQLNRNEFGFNLGGPVYIPKLYNGKNRTFWFFNYEGLRNMQYSTTAYNVPTDAQRGGDFSGLIDTQGRLYTIYDPLTTTAGPNYARTPFPGNRIPTQRESPVAKYLFGITPEPSNGNNPLNDYNLYMPTGNPFYQYYDTINLRFDQKFGDKDLAYVRYSDVKAPNSNIRSTPATNHVPGWSIIVDRDRNWAGNWSHTFSPTFFNELMYSGRYRIGGGFTGMAQSLSSDYFANLNLPNPLALRAWPNFTSLGLGNYSLSAVGTGLANETFWVLDDNLTRLHGKHEFQFGVHVRKDLSNIYNNDSGTNSFTFNTLATSLYSTTASTSTKPASTPYTGSDLANMYLGISTYSDSLQKAWDYLREGEAALYFQDNWRATSRLTVNAGLRWEYWKAPWDKNNTLLGFDLAKHAMVLGTSLDNFYKFNNAVPSVVSAYQALGLKFESYQDAGLPQNLVNSRKKNFGPRFGFAYRALDGKKSFVVRGGYSLSYFQVNQNSVMSQYNSNTPLTATFNYNPYTDATQSPNGLSNYGLMGVPQYQLGVNDRNVIDLNQPRGITRGTATANFFDPNMPTSRVHNWNLTVEKEVAANILARLRYVGNHSSYLGETWNLNNATPSYVYYATTHQPMPTGEYSNVALRPYDQTVLGTMNEYANTGWGNVQNIVVETERRYAKGYAWSASYTLSNAFVANGSVSTANQFMPGIVPTDPDQLNAFLNYRRDTGVPKHHFKWNWLVDLPFGKGKALLHGDNKVLNKIVGGWQLAGIGTLYSNYISIGSGNWNFTGAPVEFYGYKYPITNCTVTPCQRGYLWYNAYIPSNQINTPNGYQGIPANYKPYATPLIPWGSTALPANAPANLNISQYWDTNNVWLPLSNGSTQVVGYNNGLNPYRNQYLPGPRICRVDASLFKNFTISERVSLRFTVDFFNILNNPGNSNSVSGTGFLSLQTSANKPRTTQLSGRLTW